MFPDAARVHRNTASCGPPHPDATLPGWVEKLISVPHRSRRARARVQSQAKANPCSGEIAESGLSRHASKKRRLVLACRSIDTMYGVRRTISEVQVRHGRQLRVHGNEVILALRRMPCPA